MQIHPRSTIGTPPPPASRPKLNRVGVLLAHEVGVDTPATGRYRSSDPARVLSDAKAAASYGISSGRSWEYSFMIGLDGSVFTQAGEYRAQHCLNFNTDSAGVIFLNATDVPANARQIEAWHALRDHMVDASILAHDHEVAPHYRYRSTSCPGIRAQPPGGPWESPTGQGRLGNLIDALLALPIQPPKPRKRVAMFRIRFRDASYAPNAYTGLICNGPQLGWIGNGHGDVALGKGGAEIVDDMTGDELDGLIATCQTTSEPPPEFSAARKAAWNARRG